MTKLVTDVKADLDDVLTSSVKAVDRLMNYKSESKVQNKIWLNKQT